MADRGSRIEAALLVLADLIEVDPSYIPIFERLDAENAAQSSGPGARIAMARAKLKAAA